jgi:hypothetical protein
MDIEALARKVEELSRRVEELEADNTELRVLSVAGTTEGPEATLSRRKVLRKSAGMVGAGVGLAIAGSLAGPRSSRAANGGPVVIGSANTGTTQTSLTSAAANATFRSDNTGTGKGIQVIAATGNAITGQNSGNQPTASFAQTGTGRAFQASVTNSSNTQEAIVGLTNGSGSAVVGSATNNGRGGTFRGKKAQINLTPSADANHPTSGAAGDLFVDASNRLWFCKGGTNWAKVV